MENFTLEQLEAELQSRHSQIEDYRQKSNNTFDRDWQAYYSKQIDGLWSEVRAIEALILETIVSEVEETLERDYGISRADKKQFRNKRVKSTTVTSIADATKKLEIRVFLSGGIFIYINNEVIKTSDASWASAKEFNLETFKAELVKINP